MTIDVTFLRRVLLLDAVSGLLMGFGLAFGAPLAADLTGLPIGLLRAVGLALLPMAAFMYYVAIREPFSRPLVWTVIIGNVVWVVESLVLLAGGFVSPNALGIAFVLGQALVVAAFAGLEYAGVRRVSAKPVAA